MTATLDDVTKRKPADLSTEQRAATELVRLARAQGLALTGPDGLLKQLMTMLPWAAKTLSNASTT